VEISVRGGTPRFKVTSSPSVTSRARAPRPPAAASRSPPCRSSAERRPSRHGRGRTDEIRRPWVHNGGAAGRRSALRRGDDDAARARAAGWRDASRPAARGATRAPSPRAALLYRPVPGVPAEAVPGSRQRGPRRLMV
jgi:hypothetical protein